VQSYFRVGTLEFRSIDRQRHEEVDALPDAAQVDPRPESTSREEGKAIDSPWDGLDHSAKSRFAAAHATWMEDHDNRALRDRLLPLLSQRQRTIFELKTQGLDDRAVAARLGLARETVNRELGRIKHRARGIGR
jgi:DNA-binding CsgD family transcriptional regulator